MFPVDLATANKALKPSRSTSIALIASSTLAVFYISLWRESPAGAQPPVGAETPETNSPLAVEPVSGNQLNRIATTTAQTSLNHNATYVGKQVCGECHAENHRLHAAHGHAHTFRAADEPEVVEKFSGRTYTTPEGYGTYTYESGKDGLLAKIPAKFGDQPFQLQYALGSGHHGMTLLSLVPDPKEGTVGIEHRASWYRNGDQLGATPGQLHTQPETLSELFGQKHVGEVMRKCVDCHVTTGTIENQGIVNLTPNVNCEKCHGPGSVHVQQARSMNPPPPFSVGKQDWNAEAEIQLCGDCHRMPAAISQTELREYPKPLTRFQPIGLLRSECYLESEGQLKCTTCHDPHTTITAIEPQVYIDKCIECHHSEATASELATEPKTTKTSSAKPHTVCPVSATTNCIECHMPSTTIDEYGTEFHDHWIRIHPEP